VLATWARDYVNALTGTRYVGASDTREARQGVNRWIALFATAARRAVGDARLYEERVAALISQWRSQLNRVRAGSALELLINALPGAPVITVKSARGMIHRSFPTTNAAVEQLVKAGILRQIRVGRRNRAFEAVEVIAAFNDLERQLASPAGDTLVSAPSRVVPGRTR